MKKIAPTSEAPPFPATSLQIPASLPGPASLPLHASLPGPASLPIHESQPQPASLPLLMKPSLFALLLLLGSILFSCAGQPEVADPFSLPVGEPKLLVQREIGSPEVLPTDIFSDYLACMSPGPVIPGIFQGAVPQGMALLPSTDTMVISNYMDSGEPSVLTLLSMKTGEQEGYLWLHNEDGTPYTGHVGGLAVTERYLWIASDEDLFMVLLGRIRDALPEAEKGIDFFLPPPLHTEVIGAFATVVPGILLVGEFWSPDGRYPTSKNHHYTSPDGTRNHALLAGFRLDPDSGGIPEANRSGGVLYPDFFISLPDRVQGAVFIDDLLILSRSYGRKNLSTLSVYNSPLFGEGSGKDALRQNLSRAAEEPANEVEIAGAAEDFFTFENGKTVQVLHLDGRNLKADITAPPMTEGIIGYRGNIALLFESGSGKYRYTAGFPRDRMDLLDPGLFIEQKAGSADR